MDILFVVPYPELEPVVQEVYKEYPEKDKVTVEFKVMTVDMVRQYKMEREYDVLVGRNFTLEELKRQYPTKPVINIPITGYDIVQALCEAKKMYHCRKVGIVGRFFICINTNIWKKLPGWRPPIIRLTRDMIWNAVLPRQ